LRNDSIIKIIQMHEPVSRSTLAAYTGLTLTTVSSIVSNLVNKNLVRLVGAEPQGRGKPPKTYAVNPSAAYAVGINLDRDRLTGVLIDFSGNINQSVSFPVECPPPEVALTHFREVTEQLIADAGINPKKVLGVGIGFPGPLRINEGRVMGPIHFPGWDDVPLAGLLEEELKFPVYLSNNATAAAVGELWHNMDDTLQNFFYVYFSDGIGGGVIINGQLYNGMMGNAGELGFIGMISDLDYETRDDVHFFGDFTLQGLYERTAKKSGRIPDDKELLRRFEQQDPCMIDWLEKIARRIAPLLAAVEALLDPETIVFDGRLPTPLTAYLIERITQLMPITRFPSALPAPEMKFIIAGSGAAAAALGAATIPFYTMLSPSATEFGELPLMFEH
jgi:predicted NBD/HSP70 family sugar kinase